MGPGTRVLCIIFALYGLAAAQGPDFSTPNWPSSRKHGPWDVNETMFTDYMNHPNATTTFPLPGPNITNSYPNVTMDPGWSWSISVTDDIPVNQNVSELYTGNRDQKFFTGTRITLNIPPALVTSPDRYNITPRAYRNYTEWHVCWHQWRYTSLGAARNMTIPDKWRHDDGSCSSIASAACIRDWEEEAKKQYHSSSGTCSPVDVGEIPSCKGVELLHSLGGQSSWFGADNLTESHLNFIDYGGELHDRGNLTAYDKTGSLPWPLLVLWGSWAIKPSWSGDLVPINTTAKLTCVRAMNATPGSVVPGAGARGSVALHTLWLVLGLSSLLVWL